MRVVAGAYPVLLLLLVLVVDIPLTWSRKIDKVPKSQVDAADLEKADDDSSFGFITSTLSSLSSFFGSDETDDSVVDKDDDDDDDLNEASPRRSGGGDEPKPPQGDDDDNDVDDDDDDENDVFSEKGVEPSDQSHLPADVSEDQGPSPVDLSEMPTILEEVIPPEIDSGLETNKETSREEDIEDTLERIAETEQEILKKLDDDEEEDSKNEASPRRQNFEGPLLIDRMKPRSRNPSMPRSPVDSRPKWSDETGSGNTSVMVADHHFNQPIMSSVTDLAQYMRTCDSCLVQWDSFQCPLNDKAIELKKWITELEELLSFGCQLGEGCKGNTKCCHSRDPAFERALDQMTDMARQMYNTFQSACSNCPKHGGWSEWCEWGACSTSCGGGSRTRTRTCNNPHPKGGGRQCMGMAMDTLPCSGPDCCTHGSWAGWTSWGACSATCGSGMQDRMRLCSNPPPNHCGRTCPGPNKDMRDCESGQECCTHGQWSFWSSWSSCPVTCGQGNVERFRTCSNPPANFCGRPCSGNERDSKSCGTGRDCCVHGSWGNWESWAQCSSSCGKGMRERRRRCDSPRQNYCGQPCQGPEMDSQMCDTNVPCKPLCVHGDWGPWQPWSRCSASCGSGMQSRMRRCDDPSPNFCGRRCSGSASDMQVCNSNVDCCVPVNGNWGSWTMWSSCPVTCGTGRIERSRSCSNPPANMCGRRCPGSPSDSSTCDGGACCVNGNWGSWQAWGTPSVTCGVGTRDRRRRCDNPRPNYCGQQCFGPEEDRDSSVNVPCPIRCVDGNWASWNMWSSCSSTCGPGRRDRSRTCSNPPASSCGRRCPGSPTETDRCDEGPCCVNGNWGSWEQWSTPSVSCDIAMRERRRRCNNPGNNFCGTPCMGPDTDRDDHDTGIKCAPECVPRNGRWTNWAPWSPCSATCDSGMRDRSRTCTNPRPNRCGRSCFGSPSETDRCNEGDCCIPEHGNWSPWASWTQCSVSCGSGNRERSRTCSNPPANGCGRRCPGTPRESGRCDQPKCCVHGNWGSWERWSTPAVTCGTATRDRRRRCSNPPASDCGRSCMGPNTDRESFDTGMPCQVCVDGSWAAWSRWTPCSKSCGSGMQDRKRTCSGPSPNFCGRKCMGPDKDMRRCDEGPCCAPRHGNWGPWASWSQCSSTCGAGSRDRTRTCSNPRPNQCGRECRGTPRDSGTCEGPPCCVDGNWGSWARWGTPSVTCDTGMRERRRRCDNPRNNHCGRECPGSEVNTEVYNTEVPCLVCVDGSWGSWARWGTPSVTCETGMRERRRRCDRPRANTCGLECPGPDIDTEVYNTLVPCQTCVDGSWGSWERWSTPSVTCGSGRRERRRRCDNPRANFCGRACPGPETSTEIYETGVPCLVCVDGSWGSWERWGTPSVTCGSGRRERQRRCDKPRANFCGRACLGPETNTEMYETGVPCQVCVDGSWGSWERWGTPSVTCGSGRRERRRRCDQPRANFCGRACPGPETNNEIYETGVPCQVCVNGNWGQWASWGPCPVTCGQAMRERRRRCDDPAPNFCGQTCAGSPFDNRQQRCGPDPVDGNWDSWSSWGVCSRTCGGGQQERTRRCNVGICGLTCPGYDSDSRSCGQGPCCTERQWSPWSPWSQCDATCGRGRRTRQRSCTSQGFGPDCGNQCRGRAQEMDDCSGLPSCEQPWGPWSSCSATCEGSGTRERRRMSFGGFNVISGRQTEQENCQVFTPPCPQPADWTQWAAWCPCDCGKGVRSRRRTCEEPGRFGEANTVDIANCGAAAAREEEYCDVRGACPACVSDCGGRKDGDYPSCTSCNDYVRCLSGRVEMFSCTVNNYEYDAFIRKCAHPPSPSCGLRDCASSCDGREDGSYHSCFGCNAYVECRNGRHSEQTCRVGSEFNAHSDRCDPDRSPTCIRSIRRSIDFMVQDAPADSYFPEELEDTDRKELYLELRIEAGVAAKFNRTDEDVFHEEEEKEKAEKEKAEKEKKAEALKEMLEEEEDEEMEEWEEEEAARDGSVVIEETERRRGSKADKKKDKAARQATPPRSGKHKCHVDCSNVKPGKYHFCEDCQRYLMCTRHGVVRVLKCAKNKSWDDSLKRCKKRSRTCVSRDANNTRP